MKRILIILLVLITGVGYGQPNKNKVDSVELSANSLYQYINGVKMFRGSVVFPQLSGIVKDANDNVVIGIEPHITNSLNNFVQADNIFLTNSHNNSVFAKNAIYNNVNGTFSGGADHTFYRGANYAATFGDANNIGGYGSFSAGVFINNFVEYGIGLGFNIKLGNIGASNAYSRSVGIGANQNIQGTDVFHFGLGSGTATNQKGTYLTYGLQKFGLMPDGNILMNNRQITVDDNFIYVTTSTGVIKKVPLQDLSATPALSVQRPTGNYKAYTTTGQLLYLVKIN
jgi:hypothetical protein